jgi:hypothetical protein
MVLCIVGNHSSYEHLDFVLLLFGSESIRTTQPNLSSSWLSLSPLSGLLSTITNLCILAKALFDDALQTATDDLNTCQRRHRQQRSSRGIRGNIIPRNEKYPLERRISTYQAEKQ